MKESLQSLFKPKNIAVVGASRKDASPGKGIMKNLLKGEFRGKVFPVNPKADEIMGITCYNSLKDIKEELDLVFIVVPRDIVLSVLEECADIGVKAVVVISAGFKEADAEGKELEEKLAELASKHEMVLLGPNCLGVINTDQQVRMNGTFANKLSKKGHISFISQSGAVGVYALEYADRYLLNFAKFASLGNKAVSDENDMLEAYMEDEQTEVILAYLEDLSQPQRFYELAEKLRQQQNGKPLIVLKGGGSKSGKRAAESHTGALSESDEVLDDLFEQYGIIRVNNLENLFDGARIFCNQILPTGNRIGILTNAGGPGIVAADAAEKVGLEVPALSEELQKKLSKNLPPTVSFNNPIDLVGDATAERYEQALQGLLDSDEVDILLFICTPQMMTDMKEIAKTIGKYKEKASEKKKLMVTVFADFKANSKVEDIFADYQIPYFQFGNDAVAACAAAAKYSKMKSRPVEKQKVSFKIEKKNTERLLKEASNRENKFLTEPEVYQIFEDYGLNIAPYQIVNDKEKAKKAANELGYPLVAKVISDKIVHKTDAGGIFTNLRNEEDLIKAFDRIHENVKKEKPDAEISGILLQKMVEDGTEFIIGTQYKENHGHLLMFGLGGIFVEMLKDVRFRRAPLNKTDALNMIEGIRSRKVLEGMRGKPTPDKEKLAETLLRISQLVQDFPQIKEIDMNPIFAVKDDTFVADARLIVRE